MRGKRKRDFCIECRKETEYFVQKKDLKKVVNGEEYTFRITTPICTECGCEMSIPGWIDKNVKEIEEQMAFFASVGKKN